MTLLMTNPVAREGGADTFFKLALAVGIAVAGLEVGRRRDQPLSWAA